MGFPTIADTIAFAPFPLNPRLLNLTRSPTLYSSPGSYMSKEFIPELDIVLILNSCLYFSSTSSIKS